MRKIYLFAAVFLVGGVFAGMGVARGAGGVLCSVADVSGDGVVNIVDLVKIAQKFGQKAEVGTLEDANRDRIINIIDLVTVARQFGANCSDFIVGDFNGDACVNAEDLVWVARNRAQNVNLAPELFRVAEHFREGCNPPPEKLPYSVETDMNEDGVINKGDFDMVTAMFGQKGVGLPGDVDRNQAVDINDLVRVAHSLGQRAPLGRVPVCPSNKRGSVCVVLLGFQSSSITEAVVGQSIGLTATIVNETNESIPLVSAFLIASKGGVYRGLDGGVMQSRSLPQGIVLAPKSGTYRYDFDVMFTEPGTYHFITAFLKEDGVISDAPNGVMTIKVVSPSAWGGASERVVFVPIQEEPARAQGFASVLKSIFWVLGE